MSDADRHALEEETNRLEGTVGYRVGGYTIQEMAEFVKQLRAARSFNAARALDVGTRSRFAAAAARAIEQEVATARTLDTTEGRANAQVEQVMQRRDALNAVFSPEPQVPQPTPTDPQPTALQPPDATRLRAGVQALENALGG